MDLTQFPESLQKPFEDLVSTFETIYRDNSVPLIKFLNLMLCKFDDVTKPDYRDNYSQTENVEDTEQEFQLVDGVSRLAEPCGRNTDDASEQVWDLKSLAEDVRTVAEQTLKNHSSFVYDSCSGTYYNHGQQCYYIPEHKLYYYVQNKAYYTYDEDSNSLQFYSRLNSQQLESSVDVSSRVEHTESSSIDVDDSTSNIRGEPVKEDDRRMLGDDDELEEGEIDDDDDDAGDVSEEGNGVPPPQQQQQQQTMTPPIITASPVRNDLNVEPGGHCAPCVRMTVRECESNRMDIGRLFIMTKCGGTLGREGKHDIIIADSNVSKNHLSFRYRYRAGLDMYEVTDCGSRNGTYLDGSCLKPERAYQLQHGSVLKMGSTLLLCHIHDKLGTCEDCEPSCLGFMSPANPQHPAPPNPSLKQRYNLEINQIKRKFGLSKTSAGGLPFVKGYEDKSKVRRETVGSSHDSEKTDAASTEVPLRSDNRGYAMLAKMGWKEGYGVGKTAQRSTSPVKVTIKLSKRGLGCTEDITTIPKPKSKVKGLEITRKRYEAANVTEECARREE